MREVRFEEEKKDGCDDELRDDECQSANDVEPFKGDDRGLSFEDLKTEEKPDSAPKWKPVNNSKEARATIGIAFDTAWTQAKIEIEFVRHKLESHCGSRRPKFDTIFDLIFGKESAIYKVFNAEAIFDDYESYLQFLATFFLSSSHQVSTKLLFGKYSRINKDGAMGREPYVNSWKKIAAARLPSKEERNRSVTPAGMVPFWLKVENAINEYSRELFVKDFPGKMQVTLDDDKPHTQGNKYTAGLKIMRHVKDNVNGHTLHTMVLSYSQIPIQLTWEREVNDSSQEATRRLFSNGITPMAAPGQPGDLRDVATGMDRGYWIRSITHDYFMKSGAKIEAATVKRQPSIPMTYGQKLAKNDTRTDVQPTGPRTLYTHETTSYNRKLYCLGYCNGNGGVTLGLSTEYGQVPEWELVVAKPQDLKWYENRNISNADRANKSFRQLRLQFDPNRTRESLVVDLDGDFLDKVLGLPVRALTTCQGSPEWFMLRRFSLTSSTTDKAIAACKGDEAWLEHKDSWNAIKRLLKGVPITFDEQSNEKSNEPVANEEDEASVVTTAEQETDNNNSVKLTLEGLLSSDGLIQTAKHQIQYDEYDIDDVRAVLKALGKSISTAKDPAKKTANDVKSFELFLDADPRLRPHVFKSKKDLSAIGKKLGIASKLLGGAQDAVRNVIEEYLKSNPTATIEQEVSEKKKESKQQAAAKKTSKLSDQERLVYTVLKSGYMNPLKGSAKKYTRRGHLLECHIMRSCIAELEATTERPLKILQACTAPLVERNDMRYARDSIDFLAHAAVGDDNEDSFLIGVEVKARVADRTAQEATSHLANIRHLLGEDRTPRQRKNKYFEVSADSEMFTKLVDDTHEAIQTLHHAFVYDLDQVLLLIGDNAGCVLYGILITVPSTLRDAYGSVLKDLYRNSLAWVYEEAVLAPTGLERIIQCIVANGAEIDQYSFEMELALWLDINFGLEFPIPRLRHIIPLIFAIWNCIKGGSDATTNLIWHCQYSVPNKENQSIAVARMLAIAAVHVHRLYQIATAKDDLDQYSCLKRFRDSATERCPFKQTQFMLVHHITEMFKAENETPPSTPVQRGQQQVPQPVNRTMRSQANIERLNVPILQTNKTPKRNVAAKYEQMEERLVSGKLDTSSRLVLERSKECSGYPVKRLGADGGPHGKGSRGTCAVCGAQTHDFCLLCKRWLCNKESDLALKIPGWKQHVIINEDKEPIHVQRTCFFHCHKSCQVNSIQLYYNAAKSAM